MIDDHLVLISCSRIMHVFLERLLDRLLTSEQTALFHTFLQIFVRQQNLLAQIHQFQIYRHMTDRMCVCQKKQPHDGNLQELVARRSGSTSELVDDGTLADFCEMMRHNAGMPSVTPLMTFHLRGTEINQRVLHFNYFVSWLLSWLFTQNYYRDYNLRKIKFIYIAVNDSQTREKYWKILKGSEISRKKGQKRVTFNKSKNHFL